MKNTPLRSEACFKRYQQRELSDSCFICNAKPVFGFFQHWKIIANDFPYDAVATTHHMLVPNRHIGTLEEMDFEEISEHTRILEELNNGEYDAVLKNFTKAQTYPSHLHYHLLTFIRQ